MSSRSPPAASTGRATPPSRSPTSFRYSVSVLLKQHTRDDEVAFEPHQTQIDDPVRGTPHALIVRSQVVSATDADGQAVAGENALQLGAAIRVGLDFATPIDPNRRCHRLIAGIQDAHDEAAVVRPWSVVRSALLHPIGTAGRSAGAQGGDSYECAPPGTHHYSHAASVPTNRLYTPSGFAINSSGLPVSTSCPWSR